MRIFLALSLLAALFVTATTIQMYSGRACVGADPCHACTNCRSCNHCAKQGGTCGICKKR
jgi:hypothetical protein